MQPVAAVGGLALLLAVGVGVLVGAAELPAEHVVRAMADRLPLVSVGHELTSTQEAVLWRIRLPRVCLAALVGGALSVAGAAYQGVFRNPLVDPYLLGSAAGAGLGATIAIVVVGAGAFIVPPAAFVGAVVGVATAYGVASAAGSRRIGAGRLSGGGSADLLLAGVTVASFLTAVQTFVQQWQSESLRAVYSWILGQLGAADWSAVLLVAPYVVLASTVLVVAAPGVDALAFGDDKATSLGANPGRLRLVVVAAATLATAAAVAVSGLIGFVGLVVPHIVRRLVGHAHRPLLIGSLLGGAAFLVLADVVARSILAPAELPIGVVTAFVGAPFFALVLRRSPRSSRFG